MSLTSRFRFLGRELFPGGGRWWAVLDRQFAWLAAALCLLLCTAALNAQDSAAADVQQLTKQVTELSQQGKYEEAVPLAQRVVEIRKRTVGENHPDYASSLSDLAQLYVAQGQYAEAEALYKQAIAIQQKALGPNHASVGATVNLLGELYFAQGKIPEAEGLFKQALAIREKALGPKSAAVADSLADLGAVYGKQHQYAQAESLLKRALVIFEKERGPDHPDVASTLNNLAELYRDQGKYAEAEPLYQRCLAIDEKALGPDNPGLVPDLSNIAALYHEQGRYTEAEAIYKRSLQISEKALGPDHPDLALCLNNLANLYYDEGRYADAEPLYQRSLAIREKAFGPESGAVATVVGNLAALYNAQGKYADEEPLLTRALAISQKASGPESPEVASVLSDLAELHFDQGKFADAETLSKRALAIREKALGPDHPDVAQSLNNLASYYLQQGRYAEAEPLYRQAMAIWEKAVGPDGLQIATMLNNLGALFRNQGRYADAEPFYNRAIAIREKALGPEHPLLALSLNGLGEMYREEGQYSQAEPLFRRSLAIFEKVLGPDHPDVASNLGGLALLYEAQGQYAQAEPIFDRTLQNLSRQLETSFSYMSERDRLSFLRTVSDAFPRYISFATTYQQQVPQLAGKVYDLLLSEKGMVASSVAAQRARITASGDADALKLLDQLAAKKSQYAALAGMHPANYEQWRKHLDQVGEEANQLEKDLTRRSPAIAEEKELARPSWQKVRDALGKDEAAVEFVRFPFHDGKRWTGDTYYAALVVTPGVTQPKLVRLGEAKELEGSVLQDYRAWVAEPNPDEPRKLGTGRKFTAVYWEPLEKTLGGAQRVYVAPDGVLNEVSLSLLPRSDGRLVMDAYDLRTVSSTKDLLRPRTQRSTSTAVLVGNPKFSLSETGQRAAMSSSGHRSRDFHGGALDALPGTQVEVDQIAKLLRDKNWPVQTYTDAQAQVARVKEVERPRVLHLATHGFFEPDQRNSLQSSGGLVNQERPAGLEDPMLRSGLYFAGANQALQGGPSASSDEGVLTAYEASQLHLEGTELAVLSACETGLGETQNGEGVFGLRRALQEAGAESVLMSLWKVPDQETRELMQKFYEKWLAGADKAAALREAQQETREVVRQRYGKDYPYYWGAFVLIGQ